MIFVTVGTHEQPFDRLIRQVDALCADGTLTEPVMIQTGVSTYRPEHCRWEPFFPYTEMDRLMREARIVITHGGPASFLAALQLGKVPVVVPRMHSFQEHVNDHQLLFCRQVAHRCNNIILVEDAARLGEILKNYDALAAQRFGQLQSNTAVFNERIQQIAEELVLKK